VAAGAPAFLGRARECEILDSTLERARTGESAALVLRGEAGIGKTALLNYCMRRAHDLRVAPIAVVESEMQLPFAALHQLCAPMMGTSSTLPEPQVHALEVTFGVKTGSAPDRFVLGLAVLGLLAEVATKAPLVCVVDDAQWLDEASSQILGFVGRRLLAESIVLLFGVRETGSARLFPDLPDLTLDGLTDDDARALLAATIPVRLDEQVRDRLVAETRGNPLGLLELPRGMSQAELAAGLGVPVAATVPGRIEDNYLRRISAFPNKTRELMLLAAADPTGDATLLWRAAGTLGIGRDAAVLTDSEGLLEIGAGVRFRHPLVRSAAYAAASPDDRRRVHAALAAATDGEADPERRAWHLAAAAAGPDEAVAVELERCAARAQARGGLAAAGALMERSATLTPDSTMRVERRLAAAQHNLQAGAFDPALALLRTADSEATDEFTHARVELLRGLAASASNAGSEAPLRLLRAANRLEPFDVVLARQTYLHAWGAALFAGHLASPGGDVGAVSRAAKSAPQPQEPMGPFDELLDGLATLITDGRAAAAPILGQAVTGLLTGDVPAGQWLQWGVLASAAAVTLWDFERWDATSSRQVDMAREVGALAMLSIALNGRAMIAAWRGDFDGAAALVAEDDALKEATGTQIAPYGGMLLAAYRGHTAEALAMITTTIEDSVRRGEGLGVDLARWTGAILNNSLGLYREALETASPANADTPGLYISTWMLPEKMEAAVRLGKGDIAAAALHQFLDSAHPEGDWGLGVAARSRAIVSDGEQAEHLYREAIDRLARTPIRTELARANLLFGEWLRRENRRLDARAHLRLAYDEFVAMGAGGFAERARQELLATGEKVRKPHVDARNELSSQEAHIARLAREGRTNPEIAAELFLSARTVEWHLRKVFTKLGISSRRDLRDALGPPGRPSVRT
jgi:DNA-binding CsgD family transcriptional regulator